MEYIVLDLEWNQNPYANEHLHRTLPFEIIEIGAVKLDEKRTIVDRYQQVIRPRIYKKLHFKIQEITHFTPEELQAGMSFRRAITGFLNWCGEDYIFCTWGSMDLTELQNNMKYYGFERVLDFPLFYLDLQKLFSLCYEDGHVRRALSFAVEALSIDEQTPFHRALSDAYYTARVMQEMDFDKVKDRVSVDTFYTPRIKEEEIFVRFDTYTKYISREFLSKGEMFSEPDVRDLRCNICDKPLDVRLDWFSDSGKTYFCLGYCEEHGFVRGKIRVKKQDDDSFYVVKIMKSTDESGARGIYEKQESIREKRRERRQRMLDQEILIDELWDEEPMEEEGGVCDAEDDDD